MTPTKPTEKAKGMALPPYTHTAQIMAMNLDGDMQVINCRVRDCLAKDGCEVGCRVYDPVVRSSDYARNWHTSFSKIRVLKETEIENVWQPPTS